MIRVADKMDQGARFRGWKNATAGTVRRGEAAPTAQARGAVVKKSGSKWKIAREPRSAMTRFAADVATHATFVSCVTMLRTPNEQHEPDGPLTIIVNIVPHEQPRSPQQSHSHQPA